MRKLVSVREIQSIHPIEGADKIERAKVDGWDVVVSKNDHYKSGDKAIFFEIDSALPLDGAFAFLAGRSPKKLVNGVTCHVLRTAKLRGVISQGLLIRPEDLGIDLSEHDDDLTGWMEEHHGVTKWEAPLPAAGQGEQSGNFPSYLIRKTDSERIQNLASHWDEIKKLMWIATEKIDGTSATYVMTDDGLIACSRNWMIREGDNLYWRIAHEYSLPEIMPVGSALQGEIYGENVNGNRLGMKGVHFAAFNTVYGPVFDAESGSLVDALVSRKIELSRYLIEQSSLLSRAWTREIPRVPHLVEKIDDGRVQPLQLPDTIEDAIAQVNGIKSVISPSRLAEGIVWYHDRGLDFLGGRSNFKAINNKYLLKEK